MGLLLLFIVLFITLPMSLIYVLRSKIDWEAKWYLSEIIICLFILTFIFNLCRIPV